MELDHEYLLAESNTFCMYPWISAHKTPSGLTGPCCVAVLADTHGYHTVEEISDSDYMRQLRLDMLNGVKNPICDHCHQAELSGTPSARHNANHTQSQYIDVVDTTRPDGSLPEFKYRYLDVRFSNLCNMKCRSCFNGYSSQWEMEDIKYPHPENPDILAKDFQTDTMLDSIVAQIPNIDRAYFAGGEPLITEEHYVILREFIRQGNTGALITYNTNLSKLHFRDEDLLELWRQFDQHVMVFASLDHYGARAELIRHGTKWDQVEANYRRLHNMWRQGEIYVAITTTITSLNYATLHEFIEYMYDQDLVPQTWQVNFAQHPPHQCAWVLPEGVKAQAEQNLRDTVARIRERTGNPDELQQFLDVIHTVNHQNTWTEFSDMFQERMHRLDHIRGEQLTQVLPELAELYNE